MNEKGFDGKDLYSLFEEYESKSKWIYDDWQKTIMQTEGDLTLRSGRQVGKSATISRRSVKYTCKYPDTTRLVIAPAQRQSSQLFEKMLLILNQMHEIAINRAGGWKDNPKLSIRQNREARKEFEATHGIFECQPTKTEIRLKGGRRIYALPAGKTGVYLRCLTIDFLDVDEAAFVPEPVWTSILPMLAVPKKTKGLGWQCLLSTPFGKGGYFYASFLDSEFKQFHVSSEDCPRISKDFLMKQKQKLSKIEYAQEWLGEFIDEFNQFFSTDLIKKRMNFMEWDFGKEYNKHLKYFLGVDIARYGGDENAFAIVEMRDNKNLKLVACGTTERKSITDTVGRIIALHGKFNFNKILVDDAGVGGGAYDLLVEKLGKSKIVGLNNAKRRVYEAGEEKKKGILKEDLYSNAAVLMENGYINLIANIKMQRSLKSVTFEYTSDANIRIYGKYTHLAEAFVRACWCVKSKGLKLFIA